MIDSAWKNLTFTNDPLAPGPAEGAAKDAKDVGLLDTNDIEGIYDLTLLNAGPQGRRQEGYADA